MKAKTILRTVLLSAIAVIATVILCSCSGGGGEKTLYEKIVDTLEKMETFQTEAYVKYISNNKTNTYKTFQQARTSGEYRIEVTAPENVAGNITIFDGKVISQYNKNIEGKISVGATESLERSEILLTSFIRNYLSSKEVTISVSKINEERETVLEATIPGDHQYLSTEKLWVDNETLKPIELIIYDRDGAERIIVNFQNFEYNIVLDDTTFVIQ